MASERARWRGVVLAEDRRTERFIRHLLEALGYDKRKFDFQTAPSGRGAAESWVLRRYPAEVGELRRKPLENQALVAVRDGDAVGCAGRKRENDEALVAAGLSPRDVADHVATPVPTWSVESWLLHLLGEVGVDEGRYAPDGRKWKEHFEARFGGGGERGALHNAARAWLSAPGAKDLASLADARQELSRLAP